MPRFRHILLPMTVVLIVSFLAVGSVNLVSANTVSWNAPTDGATLSGTVTLKVNVPPGTAMVYYKVNETRVAIVKQAPFEWTFDTRTYGDGGYRLRAAVYSGSSSLGTADIHIRIANAAGGDEPAPDDGPTTPPSAGSISVVGNAAGYDWSLPAGTSAAPRSGIYGYNWNNSVPYQTLALDWSAMHLGDGRYDWSELERQLGKRPTVLRLKNGTPDEVPQFIRNRHNWFTVSPDGKTYIPGWQSGWDAEWNTFIQALGARYKGISNLIGIQVQDQTATGEPQLASGVINTYESRGFSPSVFGGHVSTYHQNYLRAFGGAEWKVFTVFKPTFIGAYSGAYSKADYDTALREALLPLFGQGLGIRESGLSENYEMTAAWAEHSLLRNSVLAANDAFAPIALNGHIDGQIDNYWGNNKSSRVTTTDERQVAYGIFIGIQRMLALQHSYIWLDGDDAAMLEKYYPGYVAFVKAELGKRVSKSPDAWVQLGEWGSTRAFARGLTVDVSGTSTGVRVDTSGLGFVDSQDWLGRKISRLDVGISPSFLDTQADVKIVVTYYDDSSSFRLRVGDQTSAKIGGGGSNNWRSATLSVSALNAPGGFSLEAVSGAPTIQSVRVMR